MAAERAYFMKRAQTLHELEVRTLQLSYDQNRAQGVATRCILHGKGRNSDKNRPMIRRVSVRV